MTLLSRDHDHPITRRSLLLLGGATLAASVGMGASASPPFAVNRIRAVTFDAFAVFDLRPLWVACESAFPGKGSTLSAARDPKAYQLAVNRTGYRREEILFVASAGWDAAGARWFGYPTYWNIVCRRLSKSSKWLRMPAVLRF